MNITKFQASNFKKLKAVSIDARGAIITLKGGNGAGKSCVLDGIQAAVAGKSHVCDKPIREGAASGKVVVNIGPYEVTRTFTPSGGSLIVKELGEKKSAPQAIMDGLISFVAFDPLAFSNKPPMEQRDILAKLVGLDLSVLKKKQEDFYELRTAANRDLESRRVRLAALPPKVEGAPTEEISLSQLVTELELAQEMNRKRQAALLVVRDRSLEITLAVSKISHAHDQIAAWQVALKSAEEEKFTAISAHTRALQDSGLMPETEIDPIRLRLSEAEALNKIIAKNQNRAALEVEITGYQKASESLTAQIEECVAERVKMLREAKFPIEGLSFDDAGLSFKGIPFSQVSSGERLLICAAIGMMLNPTLKVIFIRDGSLLDEKGLALLAKWATENGYQIWIEDTRSTDPAAVVIEDGQIKE